MFNIYKNYSNWESRVSITQKTVTSQLILVAFPTKNKSRNGMITNLKKDYGIRDSTSEGFNKNCHTLKQTITQSWCDIKSEERCLWHYVCVNLQQQAEVGDQCFSEFISLHKYSVKCRLQHLIFRYQCTGLTFVFNVQSINFIREHNNYSTG